MKKGLVLFSLLATMALVGCQNKAESKAASSKAAGTSKAVTSTAAPVSTAPSSSAAPVHEHSWTAGTAVNNSDGKACTPYTCACGGAKVEIALADASEGASNIGSGKLTHDSSITWKIVAPKAGNVTLQFNIQMGTSGQGSTIWGNGTDAPADYFKYEVKVGETDAEVLVNGKTYEETNVLDGEVGPVDFAKFAVVEGENVITLKVVQYQYYRNVFSGNVVLMYDAPAAQ